MDVTAKCLGIRTCNNLGYIVPIYTVKIPAKWVCLIYIMPPKDYEVLLSAFTD